MKNFRGILVLLGLVSIVHAATDPRFEQGARFEAAGQYERALGEYRAILAKEPHNAKAFYAAGAARFKMKDYKGAVANYQLAYKFDPQMAAAYEGSAAAYEKLGDKAAAAAERKKISSGKSEAPAQKSAKAKSDSKYSYSSAAFLKAKNAFDAKDYKAACSAARELLQAEPGHPGAYYYAGAGRYELGELDKAEYNLKRAFEYPALGYNAHYYLALIYQKQGKKSLEKSELEQYAGLSKNADAVAKANRRIAELSGEGEPAEISSAATDEPSKPEPLDEEPKPVPAPVPAKPVEPTIELANEAYRAGDLAKALSLYQDLSKKFRDADSRAYLLLQIGNVYRQRRDFRSAVSKYRESVELYPNSEWAIEAQRAWEDAVWQEKNADALPRKN